jgi:hypothetical protein
MNTLTDSNGNGSMDQGRAFSSADLGFLPPAAGRIAGEGRLEGAGEHFALGGKQLAAAVLAQVDAAPADAKLPRRIVYTGNVTLVVENFEQFPEKVAAIVQQFDGFIASSQISGATGSPRNGTWKVRIPVDRYDDFVAAARKLGEVQNISTDSQDVTEEYYDVEARIRNKETEEKRLLKHLTDTTGKLEEILVVEKELSRVREELERMQGRLRVLKDLVTLTTVTLHVNEIKGYVPPQAPTYGTRVSRAWTGSLDALAETAQALSIAAVAVIPWLAVPALFAVLLAIVLRRRRLRSSV